MNLTHRTSAGSPVLLHGFTGSAAAWPREITEGLASAGHGPVLLDLPGHGPGRSGAGGDDREDDFSLEAVHRRIRRAMGEEPAPLIGYSMGGRLALSFAAEHPGRVSRLVLEAASPGLADEEERAARRRRDKALALRIEEGGMAAFVDEWERLPLFESQNALPEEVRRAQRELRLRHDSAPLAEALRCLGTGALPSYWEELVRMELPVLLIAGELDTKFVKIARKMARRLPDARLVITPGAGHRVHLERPGAWLSAVVAFLAAES
ncbi:MAG: 2-succinyl-6-hydroxy-2,4-cyclohexadiene-1-carboxylate synthase [Gemmatimonadota bacterium]